MWPFSKEPKKPKPPNIYNVRRATVLITEKDGKVWSKIIYGRVVNNEDKIYFPAEATFDFWQEENGKTGMVNIGEGIYIPFCNIERLSSSFEDFNVECPGT